MNTEFLLKVDKNFPCQNKTTESDDFVNLLSLDLGKNQRRYFWPKILKCQNKINNFEFESIYNSNLKKCYEAINSNPETKNPEIEKINDSLKWINRDLERCDKNLDYFQKEHNCKKLRNILLV